MEFGMDKCMTVHPKKGKICDIQDIEMVDGQQMKRIKEMGYIYLGILQESEMKTKVMKYKIRTEYFRRVRKLAKSKQYARNVFIGIDQWVW